MMRVSERPAKELEAVHMSVLVIISTGLPAGRIPFVGSRSHPQLSIVAFNSATVAAVPAF